MSGIFHPQLESVDSIMPYPPYPTYPSGIIDSGKAIYRYAHNPSEHPVLIISDPIYDSERNCIMPGYYELVLSDDRNFLLLVQSGKILAIFPVFKLEEDKEALALEKDKKYLKQKAKKDKKQAKIDAKRARQGLGPEFKDDIYMDATIEYDKSGNYYLIKYERGKIRAWGAIKQ